MTELIHSVLKRNGTGRWLRSKVGPAAPHPLQLRICSGEYDAIVGMLRSLFAASATDQREAEQPGGQQRQRSGFRHRRRQEPVNTKGRARLVCPSDLTRVVD